MNVSAISGEGVFDNHDIAKDAVSSLALMAKFPSGGVPLGLAAWAVQLTGPEILWLWPFNEISACAMPPAGLVVAVAELRAGREVGAALL